MARPKRSPQSDFSRITTQHNYDSWRLDVRVAGVEARRIQVFLEDVSVVSGRWQLPPVERVSPRSRAPSGRIAWSTALGLKCMYRCVVQMFWCSASS